MLVPATGAFRLHIINIPFPLSSTLLSSAESNLQYEQVQRTQSKEPRYFDQQILHLPVGYI